MYRFSAREPPTPVSYFVSFPHPSLKAPSDPPSCLFLVRASPSAMSGRCMRVQSLQLRTRARDRPPSFSLEKTFLILFESRRKEKKTKRRVWRAQLGRPVVEEPPASLGKRGSGAVDRIFTDVACRGLSTTLCSFSRLPFPRFRIRGHRGERLSTISFFSFFFLPIAVYFCETKFRFEYSALSLICVERNT